MQSDKTDYAELIHQETVVKVNQVCNMGIQVTELLESSLQRSNMDRMKVLLLGRFPATGEVGGVTTFTYNLSERNKDIIDNVVDFYPSDDKSIPEGVQAKFVSGSFLVRLFKLFFLHFQSNTLFHHNYSTVRGLIPLSLFPKRKGTKWMLTLHHGDLEHCYGNQSVVTRAIIRFCLNRFDVISSISEKQDAFYEKLTTKKKYRVSPFVKTDKVEKDMTKVNGEHNETLPIFLIAGYPTKIYRHLETIRVFQKLWQSGYRFKLSVCLYGNDTDGIEHQIAAEVLKAPFAKLFTNMDAFAFQEVLKQADIYIRMNAVDSYGLIVAEAAQYDLKVIATKVCTRYPGTFLIEKDDFDLLEKVLKQTIEKQDLSNILDVQTEKLRPIEFRSLYQQELQSYAV